MQLFVRSTLLFLVLSLASVSETVAKTKDIVILHTNDIESVYEPIESYWRDDIKMIGGIPHLATLIPISLNRWAI